MRFAIDPLLLLALACGGGHEATEMDFVGCARIAPAGGSELFRIARVEW
jgi:hypothetical protein